MNTVPTQWWMRPDGTLSTSGKFLLSAVKGGSMAEDVSAATGMPLYRVRSGLRELEEGGFVSAQDGHYSQTEKGADKANQFG